MVGTHGFNETIDLVPVDFGSANSVLRGFESRGFGSTINASKVLFIIMIASGSVIVSEPSSLSMVDSRKIAGDESRPPLPPPVSKANAAFSRFRLIWRKKYENY